MKSIPAVVAAGGYGKVLRPGLSKLGDELEGKPVLVHVVENIKATGLFNPIVLVVNPLTVWELMNIMKIWGHDDLLYVVQPERRGAADAVFRAMPILKEFKASAFLSIFGEMPLVAPETMQELAELHALRAPQVTSLCCPFDPDHPVAEQVSWYCYLKQGWDSVERSDPFLFIYSDRRAECGDDILGNVYVFDTSWFEQSFALIDGMDNKRDGFGAEFHLPKLVELAVQQGDNLLSVRRNVQEQILGINNLADYQVAQMVMKRLKGGCG